MESMNDFTGKEWKSLLENDIYNVVTFDDEWFICEICRFLPGDEDGSKTAQYIVNLHNDALRERGAKCAESAGQDRALP